MNLQLFKEHYKIVSQETVDVVYDIELRDVQDDEQDLSFEEIINDFTQRDEFIEHHEYIKYVIYNNDDDDEPVFETTDPDSLMMIIKTIIEKLEENENRNIPSDI